LREEIRIKFQCIQIDQKFIIKLDMKFSRRVFLLLIGVSIIFALPQMVNGLPKPEIIKIAKEITVKIDGNSPKPKPGSKKNEQEPGSGSGVIIQQDGNVYTLITCWHVVKTPGIYTIEAFDGKFYQVDSRQFQKLDGVDLAFIKFTSDTKYRVAELLNLKPIEGTEIHIIGWANPYSINAERGYLYSSGYISQIVNKPQNGYALVYTGSAKHGTSGAPILDKEGRIIGIHGQLDDWDTGETLFAGIPITTYQKFTSRVLAAKPVAQIVAALPSNPISTPVSELPKIINKKIVVVIDPGHGGKDPGTIGIDGIKETEIALDISLQVAAILQRQGSQVVLTRTSDTFIGLDERVTIAREAKGTLFVSIHATSIDNRPDVNGLETYHFNIGKNLANTIHSTILKDLKETGILDRAVRTARFLVLRKSTIPAVLIETGYVTNDNEAKRLSNPNYRSQLALAIARGILEYSIKIQ
jgi:N-acetylmuramoyl-L-alanine amidase